MWRSASEIAASGSKVDPKSFPQEAWVEGGRSGGSGKKLSRFPLDRHHLGERDQERGKKSRLCDVGSWVWGIFRIADYPKPFFGTMGLWFSRAVKKLGAGTVSLSEKNQNSGATFKNQNSGATFKKISGFRVVAL